MRINIFLIFITITTFIILLSPSIINAGFSKPNNNLVLQNGVNTWDNDQVYGPSVIIQNDITKLWYSGSNGTKRQIGYSFSSSSNPLGKRVTPVLAWDIIDKYDIGVEHPSVIIRDNLPQNYLMWFSNVSQNFQIFNIYYSDSNNGEVWNKPKLITFNLKDTTWDSKGMGAPSVLFDNKQNIYRMWYVAYGILSSSTRWRIGYAESDDGIKWTKHPEPVLKADQAWEGVDVGNPSVVYDGKLYHMWYHGDRDIGHATSEDGIIWEKDKNNPVLTVSSDPSAFDSRRVLNPFVLQKDNTNYMWYTGINKDGKWQIGLAKEELPEVPKNTPTPTPIQDQSSSPIVIIPGLGASWNPKTLFSCDLRNSSNWKLAPYVSVYRRLIRTLTKNAGLRMNKDVYVYGYDWRQDLDNGGRNLKNYIESILKNHPSGTKVRLIGHSLGGLEIRSLLTHYPNFNKIASVLTVGTPHRGTLTAYPIWEKGEIPSGDRIMRIAVNNLMNVCKLKLRPEKLKVNNIYQIKLKSNREIIQKVLPVIQELLPAFDYLKMDGNILDTGKLIYQNEWIKSHSVFLAEAPIFTLSGNNHTTQRFFNIITPSGKDLTSGDWIDGKPIGSENTLEGDDTILQISSRLENGENWIIDGNHAELVYSDPGIGKILQYLNLPEVKVSEIERVPEIESDSVLTFSSDLISQMNIADPKREKYEGDENIIVVFDPKIGIYRLKLKSESDEVANLYVNFIGKNNITFDDNFELKIPKGKTQEYFLTLANLKNPKLNLIPIK